MEKKTRGELELLALNIRRETMHAIASVGEGHIGGTLSLAEVMAVLYGQEMKFNPQDPNWAERDRLVLSKGHCGPALYATLALSGFYPTDWLETMNRPGTRLPSHADRLKTPGIDATTGSLGQGLSVAAGIALGNRLNGVDSYTYAICGDGECNEGQIWEAALFGAHWKLDHLIAFVDNNKQQADGWGKDVCNMGDMRQKFEDFGWFAQDVNGHDVMAIAEAIARAKEHTGGPSMIILDTDKGHGLKKYSGLYGFHNGKVSAEDMAAFKVEFEEQEARIRSAM